MVVVRVAETRDEVGSYVAVRNALTRDEPSDVEQQWERRRREPRRLYLLGERDGRAVGCGFAGPSQSIGSGFVSPCVLPAERRRGVGSTLLRCLTEHLAGLGFSAVSAHVDGADAGSLAFAERHGFVEVDRQVEQVKRLGAEPAPVAPAGVTIVAIADRPDLLRESYDLAVEGYADIATAHPVTISLEEWLDEEATLPSGSFVALANGVIVGYSGLSGQRHGVVSDGLTVVRRAWRRRGLAQALKRFKLAWAAENGIAEIVTWTQRGNEAMRTLNEQLGYVYRGVSVTVRRPLPLEQAP